MGSAGCGVEVPALMLGNQLWKPVLQQIGGGQGPSWGPQVHEKTRKIRLSIFLAVVWP